MKIDPDYQFRNQPAVRRTCFLVLGMHRSGTSAITRVLSLLGAELPQTLMKPQPGNNEAGFWESQALVLLHEKLLADCASSWDDWRPLQWEAGIRASDLDWRATLAQAVLAEYRGAGSFALKDPRICRFAPLYFDVLDALGADTRIVLPIRHPHAVAASLRRRDEFTQEFAELLWLRHVLDAERASRGRARTVIGYEHLLSDRSAVLARIRRDLGMPILASAEATREIDAYLRTDLDHHGRATESASATGVGPILVRAYSAIQRLQLQPQDAAACAVLDSVRSEFEALAKSLGDAVHGLHRRAELRKLVVRIAQGDPSDVASSDPVGPAAAEPLVLALADAHDQIAALRSAAVKRVSEIDRLRLRRVRLVRRAVAVRHERDSERQAAREVERDCAAARVRIAELEPTVGRLRADAASQDRALRLAIDDVEQLRKANSDCTRERDALKDKLADQVTALARAKDLAQKGARDLAGETATLAQLRRQSDGLTSDLRQLETRRELLQSENARLVREADEARWAAVVAARQCDVLKSAERDIRNSTSWRVTAPLRVASERVGKLRRGAGFGNPQATGRSGSNGAAKERQAIANSGYFDATWYAARYPDVAGSGLDPAQHFLEFGARERRDPGPNFSTEAYFAANPDVKASGVNALVHYIKFGEREGRKRGSIARRPETHEFPDTFALKTFVQRSRVAVVVHVFYPEVWSELRDAALRIPGGCDLFVTLVKGASDGVLDDVRGDVPDAAVLVLPNHGRDIFPFLFVANTGVLCKYDLVCKIHSKKSPHREDGSVWRRSLIKSLLGSPNRIEGLFASFAAHPDLGIVAADGNVFSSEYWGSNEDAIAALAARAHVSYRVADVRFAAGSMFWMHPLIVRQLMMLGLTDADFEPEGEQLDGTMAHAMERFIGILAQSMGFEVRAANELADLRKDPAAVPTSTPKLIAFYLPQYHPIAENDEWWGKGFTEWRSVTKAASMFDGHSQPRVPEELGYYDLRIPEVQEQQARLARSYGIDAFCYYYYWFDGRRLLERPLDAVMSSGRPDFPFCLCWANENWTRSWDGLHRDVLLSQTYGPESLRTFATELIPYFRDARYLRHRGCPVLLIYRLSDIPAYRSVVREWRRMWTEAGVGPVHLAAVRFHLNELPRRPQDAGLDAYVEFPPHGVRVARLEKAVSGLRAGFQGLIYSYPEVVNGSLEHHAGSDTSRLHRGVMLGWDNTARRGAKAHICHGATPGNFRRWLRGAIQQEMGKRPGSETLLFINAWNEWAEGTYLEPDTRSGRGYLEAVRSAKGAALAAWQSPVQPARRDDAVEVHA